MGIYVNIFFHRPALYIIVWRKEYFDYNITTEWFGKVDKFLLVFQKEISFVWKFEALNVC